MRSRSLLAASAAVVACLVCLQASQPASMPASSSPAAAATDPDDLDGCIRAIRAADEAKEAIEAYARGCSIDRTSIQLQETYMLAMLRLGQPRTAVFPARALLGMKPDFPMAWAVVGYHEAKRKRLAKALDATMLAVGKSTDNPSVLHNAGQLLAWYENQAEPPRIDDATIRAIENGKANLAKNETFAKSRKSTQAQYDRRKKLRDQYQTKIDAAKGEAKEILTAGKAIDRTIAALTEEIKSRKETIVDLSGQHRRLRDQPESDISGTRRALLDLKITHERQTVETLEDKLATNHARGRQELGNLRRKLAEVSKLERDMSNELGRRPIRFRWDPPAVNGVVTPEAPVSTPTINEPTSADSGGRTPEAHLKMARLYLKNKMPEKAAAILNYIVAKYPASSAAAAAKDILAKLKSGK